MFLKQLGRRLRERRELRRLTQGDIASALQINPQAVSKWERGDNAPDIVSLPALANILGVTTDWLLGNDGAERDEFEATGRAHLTTIGHAEYARPDLLGRTVNCAFRVNAWAATNAESRIAIASEGVLHLEQQFLLKPSSAATLKGIAEPVQISEVLGHNKRE